MLGIALIILSLVSALAVSGAVVSGPSGAPHAESPKTAAQMADAAGTGR